MSRWRHSGLFGGPKNNFSFTMKAISQSINALDLISDIRLLASGQPFPDLS